MKKIYITPQMTVFHTVVTSMIAESTVGLNKDAGNKLGSEDILTKQNGNMNIWDDDEE